MLTFLLRTNPTRSQIFYADLPHFSIKVQMQTVGEASVELFILRDMSIKVPVEYRDAEHRLVFCAADMNG